MRVFVEEYIGFPYREYLNMFVGGLEYVNTLFKIWFCFRSWSFRVK